MNSPPFLNDDDLADQVDAYFRFTGGGFKNEKKLKKKTDPVEAKKEGEREPATITGLAFFLGFNSRTAFEDYEHNGPFATMLKRARLRIESIYETKLHQQSPAGAMFALKSFGWDERPDNKANGNAQIKTLTVEIVETGFQPSGSENEVIL
jgi:hypothetical protein